MAPHLGVRHKLNSLAECRVVCAFLMRPSVFCSRVILVGLIGLGRGSGRPWIQWRQRMDLGSLVIALGIILMRIALVMGRTRRSRGCSLSFLAAPRRNVALLWRLAELS